MFVCVSVSIDYWSPEAELEGRMTGIDSQA